MLFYILISIKKKKIFKIGKADNVVNRYESLTNIYGDFDLKTSYYIKCKDESVFKLESILHYIFKDFNVIQDNKEGYTEWFDIKCYEQVIEMVKILKKINSDIFNIEQNINLLKEKKTLKLTYEEKRSNHKKKKQLNFLSNNIKNANIIVEILTDIKNSIIFFNKEQNLIVFKNVDINTIWLLERLKFFEYRMGSFNFVGIPIELKKNLITLELKFDYFEYKDIQYEEIIEAYKIILNFFNNLNLELIETDKEIGLKYVKKDKISGDFFKYIATDEIFFNS